MTSQSNITARLVLAVPKVVHVKSLGVGVRQLVLLAPVEHSSLSLNPLEAAQQVASLSAQTWGPLWGAGGRG